MQKSKKRLKTISYHYIQPTNIPKNHPVTIKENAKKLKVQLKNKQNMVCSPNTKEPLFLFVNLSKGPEHNIKKRSSSSYEDIAVLVAFESIHKISQKKKRFQNKQQ